MAHSSSYVATKVICRPVRTGGYGGIFTGGQVVEVACWARVLRKWYEARTTDSARAHHPWAGPDSEAVSNRTGQLQSKR